MVGILCADPNERYSAVRQRFYDFYVRQRQTECETSEWKICRKNLARNIVDVLIGCAYEVVKRVDDVTMDLRRFVYYLQSNFRE